MEGAYGVNSMPGGKGHNPRLFPFLGRNCFGLSRLRRVWDRLRTVRRCNGVTRRLGDRPSLFFQNSDP